MGLVSVVMPTYNCGAYIGEAIKSVLRQSHEDLELIVVDDGSEDDTGDIVALHSADKRLVYVRIPRSGVSSARNHGIRVAKGEKLALIDSDDVFLKEKLNEQLDFMERSGCRVSYTKAVYFCDWTSEEVESTCHPFSGDIFYYLKRSNFIHPSTIMADSDVIKKYGFDEKLLPGHEDWDMCLRMAADGTRFGYIDKALTRIRLRPRSTTVNKISMDSTRREVGLKARAYWDNFKSGISISSSSGRRALGRYVSLKTMAFLAGFPGGERYNRPTPNEILWAKVPK